MYITVHSETLHATECEVKKVRITLKIQLDQSHHIHRPLQPCRSIAKNKISTVYQDILSITFFGIPHTYSHSRRPAGQ